MPGFKKHMNNIPKYVDPEFRGETNLELMEPIIGSQFMKIR